jgi:Bacterial type II/III secretion system short domain
MNAGPLRRLLGYALVLGAVASVSGFLAADDKPQQPAEGEAAKTTDDFTVLPLKKMSALEAAKVVQDLLGTGSSKRMRVIADNRTNSLLVSGSVRDAALVNRLIELLDVDRRKQQEQRIVAVVELQNAVPDKGLEEALQLLMDTYGNGGFALDPRRHAVVVQGDEQAIKAARELIARLDQPQEKPRSQEMQIRVVWLASGLERKDMQPPPRDLQEVVAELAKIGVDDLRLVSQSLVNATEGNGFTMNGLAMLDKPCSLSINGSVLSRASEAPVTDITIIARQQDSAKTVLCQLDTRIAAPLGHSVVLGVTPTEKSTSVFIVQLLAKKGSTPASRR